MFEGFELDTIEVRGVALRVRHGGRGPCVVLLHGHPRTHVTWHRVAPRLTADFTVVCPDLRGYGQSSKPTTTADHAPYSKREMASDVVALARSLGHARFAVVGHDRGAYVAFRTAMDHPDAVTHLCAIDAVPIGDALGRADASFAQSWWHWFFFGQTDKRAEDVIGRDPDWWYRATAEEMGADAYKDYRAAIHDPATVHAMMEDYRAGLGIDRAHDDADRAAGRKIACPTLILWASRDDMEDLYGDPSDIWRTWRHDATGRSIDSGHHVAEDAPEELAAELRRFLSPA